MPAKPIGRSRTKTAKLIPASRHPGQPVRTTPLTFERGVTRPLRADGLLVPCETSPSAVPPSSAWRPSHRYCSFPGSGNAGAGLLVTTASFECAAGLFGRGRATLTFRSTSVGDGGIRRQDWDLDGDGAYDDFSGPVPTRTFPTAGSFVIGLQVFDGTAAFTRPRGRW